jgi:Lon protease-like protein
MTKSSLWMEAKMPPNIPRLERLRKEAKALVNAHRNRDGEALAFIRRHHPKWANADDQAIAAGSFRLSDAQWAIARAFSAPSWPALVASLTPNDAPRVPLIPIRGIVVFPGHRAEIHIGRARSIAALEAARRAEGSVVLVAQRDGKNEAPRPPDLHEIGTLCRIVSVTEVEASPGVAFKVDLEGRRRAHIERIEERDETWLASLRMLDDSDVDPHHSRQTAIAALRIALERVRQIPEVREALPHIVPLVLPHLRMLPPELQQQLLETADPRDWLTRL